MTTKVEHYNYCYTITSTPETAFCKKMLHVYFNVLNSVAHVDDRSGSSYPLFCTQEHLLFHFSSYAC